MCVYELSNKIMCPAAIITTRRHLLERPQWRHQLLEGGTDVVAAAAKPDDGGEDKLTLLVGIGR